jgi:hypothetical protein
MISEAPLLRKEQRRTPRYTFIASAELIEEKTDVRIATRVSELSLNGCYLDMMNPFPQDTLVLVKIFAGDQSFQAKSKNIHPKPPALLQHWLDQAQKDGQQRSG